MADEMDKKDPYKEQLDTLYNYGLKIIGEVQSELVDKDKEISQLTIKSNQFESLKQQIIDTVNNCK